MMKKFSQLTFRLFLIISLLIPMINPLTVKASDDDKTIKELRADLAALKQKKQDNENKKQMTESEIAAAKQKIANSLAQKQQAEKDIEAAILKIEETEKEIEQLKKETEALLRYFQITQGDNVYTDYLADATSLKDLIRRLEAVEQITNYSNQTLEKLDNLIKENEQLQEDLKQKQIELDRIIAQAENDIVVMEGQVQKIGELSVDISDEINTLQARINYFKSICPNEDTPTSKCTDVVNASGWLRPVGKGVITSAWGLRVSPITGLPNEYHNAVDISGVPEGTPLYASVPATVGMIIYRSSCGGNQVYLHAVVNGQKYTVHYGHLLTINVSLYQKVDVNTIIGTMGGYSTGTRHGGYDRCTTGTHVHYGISKGHYGSDYYDYNTFILNGVNPPGFPAKGVWWYTR